MSPPLKKRSRMIEANVLYHSLPGLAPRQGSGPIGRDGRFTSSWRDVPPPDAGRIVGSNLRLGHLQGGSSANALQERVCTHLCCPKRRPKSATPSSAKCSRVLLINRGCVGWLVMRKNRDMITRRDIQHRDASSKKTSGPRRREPVLAHNFGVARHSSAISIERR